MSKSIDGLHGEDRRAALAMFDPENIDSGFLPFLDRINRLPFVVTVQCCVGHNEYKGVDLPSGRWGYLQMYMTFQAAESLIESLDNWDWLWLTGSQIWLEGSGEPIPVVTPNGSYDVVIAWDAKEWPRPAHDICDALEKFFEQETK